ncbi:MAG: acyl-CoA thioesterase/BAAT N-terminal domain-containing protein [Pseudomonadota bacterium]
MTFKPLSIFASVGLLAACATNDPLVTLSSETSLSGDPVIVRINNAPEIVRISAQRAWGWSDKTIYRSTAVFDAPDGIIDLSEQAPVSGSYNGVSPAGMFWSMSDTETPASDPVDTEVIEFSFDFGDDGTVDYQSSIRLTKGVTDIDEIAVGDELPEAFLLKPRDSDKPPVVILVGGSEGGDSAARNIGTKLASRGYAVLGVPYYSPAYGNAPQQFPALPAAFENIPIDKMEIARDWIQSRGDVDGSRIALYGASKGAEFVLEAASRIEGFSAVAAIVPSDVIWEGWGPGTVPGEVSSFSWHGKPLPFVPYRGMAEEFAKFGQPGETVRIRTPHDAGREENPDRVVDARIRVERIDEPVFVVGGDEDNTWASGPMARNIKATRDAAGLQTTMIVGVMSGHNLSGDGYSPMDSSRGYAAGAEESMLRLEAWQSLLTFLDTHLNEAE